MERANIDIKVMLVAWLLTGLLEPSLFNFIRILAIIQESGVHCIQPCLEVKLELGLLNECHHGE